MKNKKFKKSTRYLLALGLVSIVAASALSATTYAWFLVNRYAGGSVGNITAGTVGTLDVSTTANSSADDPSWGDSFTLDIPDSDRFTDVSGDGLTFYKPILSADSFTAGTLTFTHVNQVSSAAGYYYDFNVAFRSAAELTIYLGEGTAVTSSVDADYATALRVAFLNNTKTAVTNIYTSQTATLQYISTAKASTATPAAATEFYDDLVTTSTMKVLQGALVNKSLNNEASPSAQSSNALVKLEKTGSEPYYFGQITVRYWIEGTDPNCISDYIANSISTTLVFYGLEPDTIG